MHTEFVVTPELKHLRRELGHFLAESGGSSHDLVCQATPRGFQVGVLTNRLSREVWWLVAYRPGAFDADTFATVWANLNMATRRAGLKALSAKALADKRARDRAESDYQRDRADYQKFLMHRLPNIDRRVIVATV